MGFSFIDYFGHTIGQDGVATRNKKVEEILKVGKPETKTQIRSLLGMMNFCRKFFPNMPIIAMPLVDCIRKVQLNKVIWGDPLELAFHRLGSFIVVTSTYFENAGL